MGGKKNISVSPFIGGSQCLTISLKLAQIHQSTDSSVRTRRVPEIVSGLRLNEGRGGMGSKEGVRDKIC